nr:MAG TPA: hypothetical protein [Caudoviricetes sp.]
MDFIGNFKIYLFIQRTALLTFEMTSSTVSSLSLMYSSMVSSTVSEVTSLYMSAPWMSFIRA